MMSAVPFSVDFHVPTWSPPCERLFWRIIFTSNRSGQSFGSPLYSVAVEGGLPEPLSVDVGTNGMIKQDGSMLAFNRIPVRYCRRNSVPGFHCGYLSACATRYPIIQ